MRLKGVVFSRVAILIIALAVFIAGTLALFAVMHHRQEMEKLYVTRATLMGHEVQRLLLWDDRVGIKTRLSTLVRTDTFLSYAFVTVEGRPLVWTFPEGIPRELLKHSREVGETPARWVFQDEQKAVFCDIAVPLDHVSGVLHIGLERREIDRDLVPLLVTIAVLAAVAVSEGLLLAFLLAGWAVREVEVLTEVVHSWVEGDERKGHAPPSTSVEVADLARDFERMLADRRQAEATISDQNEFLSNIIGALKHPLYVIDAEDYSVKLANPAARALGIEEGSLCYAVTRGRSTPCDGPCPLAMVKASGEDVTIEHAHLDPNGKRRTFEIHGFPVTDDEGRVVQMIKYTLDITERTKAEEALRQSNRELALLNWVIGAAASGMDEEEILSTACTELGRTLEAGRVVAVMLEEGGQRVRVVAEHVEEGLLPMLGESIESSPESLLRTVLAKRQPIVSPDVTADPRLEAIRPLLNDCGAASVLLVPLIIDDRVGGLLGVAASKSRDFSDDELGLSLSVAGQLSSSLALAKVNSTRRRLQTVIEQTEDSVVITDTAGDIVYVNPAFERVTGYQWAEALGQNPRMLKSGGHDEAFYEELWASITGGRAWRGRIVNKKKDGSLFTEDAVIAPVRAEDGTITNFVAVKRDVTREIGLEEQFLEAQRMEGIGRLAGGIAHDFNNLLGVIMGYAELTVAQVPKDSPLRESIQEIVSASEQAARLTRQLLIFGRSQPSEMTEVSLNTIIRGIEKMFGRLIGEDIVIETVLDPHLAPVRGNPSRFEQVLLNLVINARDAMPGCGRMTIQTRNVQPAEDIGWSYGVRRGDSVCLSVSDTGTGIPDEIKEHIFEPFFSTKEHTRGTGLGLSTCYGIVTQCGGSIEVESAVGEGTTVRVFLPAYDPDDLTAGNRLDETSSAAAEGSEVILLAEDDKAFRCLAVGTLRRLGYSVLEAADGEEALARAQEHDGTIDLLVTDVVMPRLPGPEAAASLMRTFPEIKVIFISGYSENPLCLDDFGDAVLLQKPFKPSDLAHTIREILDR